MHTTYMVHTYLRRRTAKTTCVNAESAETGYKGNDRCWGVKGKG